MLLPADDNDLVMAVQQIKRVFARAVLSSNFFSDIITMITTISVMTTIFHYDHFLV